MVQKKRHIAKALTWRLVGTIDTFLLAWLLTGDMKLGATFSVVEIVTKTMLYYGHERIWYQFKWGVEKRDA